MHLRTRVVIELTSLAAATVLFLLLFPNRTTVINMSLAVIAVLGLAASRRFTRDRIWARFPPHGERSERHKQASKVIAVLTSAGVLVFLATGAVLGYREAGWPGVVQRFANWNILIAITVYLPWALLQQVLFQFYLLGRLLVIQKTWVAIVFTGLAYSLVHLPHVGVSIAAAGAGIVWTILYYRYRFLSPIAVSHAILGATFFYWVYDRDLVALGLKLAP